MSIRGSWPMGTRCEVEAGGAAGDEVEPPQDTAPIPPDPEQAEAAKKRKQMARSHRACRFMAFSVYLPEPIRSSRCRPADRRDPREIHRELHDLVRGAIAFRQNAVCVSPAQSVLE
jgi:hypothetical protein